MAEPPTKVPRTEVAPIQSIETADFSELMKQYYSRFFPYDEMFRWLSYGSEEYFHCREFSFTLPGEIYVRYQSFPNCENFHNEIIKRNPEKIDIGAVFTNPPAQRASVSQGQFVPQSKELVFDIDMTDYDEVRTCCSGADICLKCWGLMTVAVECLQSMLKGDFGFEHLLFVYSGRRGIHCWVCDERAREMDNEERTAVATYLQVMTGGGDGSDRIERTFNNLEHPSTMLVFKNILEPRFAEIVLKQQGWLDTPDRTKKILDMISPADVQSKVAAGINANKDASGLLKWEVIKEILWHNKETRKSVRSIVFEIVFAFIYPRLDINVSKQVNHLLKSPFCVHPKTGRVCVPIHPDRADEFNPLEVPTVSDLLRQYNDHQNRVAGEAREQANTPAYSKTALKESMEIFKEFLDPLEDSLWASKQKDMKRKGQSGVSTMDIEDLP